MLFVYYKLVGMMTFMLGPPSVGKTIFLLVLADKLDFDSEVTKSITPKLHKKSICTKNQSSILGL
jgi:hypothetical protein